MIQHQLRHVDEANCTGCDDVKIIKLNRSEVSVDANSYYLLSPSDPGVQVFVELALVCMLVTSSIECSSLHLMFEDCEGNRQAVFDHGL